MKSTLRLLVVFVMMTTAVVTGGAAHAENCPVALTYDDGPGRYTNQVVDAFAAHGAVATFFMTGVNAKAYSGVAQNVAAHGNQIGNHSVRHDHLIYKSAQAAGDDIRQAQDMIREATGITPLVMRPPYGETNDEIIANVGMPEIKWSYDSIDYVTQNTDSTIRNVTNNVHCGDIILMHDIHASTARAASPILDNLQSRGFYMVTVEQLIGTPPVGLYVHQ